MLTWAVIMVGRFCFVFPFPLLLLLVVGLSVDADDVLLSSMLTGGYNADAHHSLELHYVHSTYRPTAMAMQVVNMKGLAG